MWFKSHNPSQNRPLVFCLAIAVILLLSSCVHVPDSWTTISYDGFGEMAVPESDWCFCLESGNLCVKDSNGNYIMRYINDVEEYTEIKYIQGESFSGGGYAYETLVSMIGEEKVLLIFDTPGVTDFIVVDESVDYETLRKMAKSFVLYD